MVVVCINNYVVCISVVCINMKPKIWINPTKENVDDLLSVAVQIQRGALAFS